MTPIPRSEFDLLLHDIEHAVGCAALGGRVTGHDILLEGLKRIEYARLEGEEWAPELIARYRQAIGEYLHFYGMRLG
jgi:hypothetical protein